MKTLNSKEAFEAMMAGRNILCRTIGEFTLFDDLDQFPATVFAMPGYEYCIKVETMELAGITFTKPLTLDDVVEDQEIFLVYPDHVAHTQFTSLCGKYIECVRNGFAQADQQNAELQLQAIGKLFGREINHPLTIQSHVKVKKKRSTKTKNEEEREESIDLEKMFETILTNITGSTTHEEVLQSCFSLQQYGFSEDQIAVIENAKSSKIDELNPQAKVEADPANNLDMDELKRLQLEAEALLEKPNEEPAQVIDVFSSNKRDQMIKHLNGLETVEKLERYAPCITAARSSMTVEDHQEVLTAYAARKEVILQQDLFGESA